MVISSRGGSVNRARSSSADASAFCGLLVQNGESSHYVNEILLSRVLEEEEEIHSVMSDSQGADDGNDRAVVLQPMTFPFGLPRMALRDHVQDLFPSRRQVSQLWQSFVQNSDSMHKVLHIPTTEIAVFTWIEKPRDVPEDISCLLFAIYFSALTSLWPDEVSAIMGRNKEESLSMIKLGFEISLARANIMEKPSIAGLQGISIFLQSMRAHRNSRSEWVFLGLALRAAQSIGLHRDAANFPQLSPFNIEMRRRLWWHLYSHECRAAEDHGFAAETSSDYGSDVQLPLHVDDAMLDPAMTELPVPQQQFTGMTCPLVIIQSAQALRQLSHAIHTPKEPHATAVTTTTTTAAAVTDIDTEVGETARQGVIDDLTRRVGQLLGYCNPVIPHQRAILLNGKILLRKRAFVSRVQLLSSYPPSSQQQQSQGSSFPNQATLMEETLAAACDILEMGKEYCRDEMLRSYIWLAESYQPYHLLLYVLWHLGVRPVGPNTARAWAAVEAEFDQEAMRIVRQGGTAAAASRPSGPKWAIFCKLKEKAAKVRPPLVDRAAAGSHMTVKEAMDEEDEGAGVVSQGDYTEESTRESLQSGNPYTGFLEWDRELGDWNGLLTDFNAREYDL
ncbi:hypothetical protein DL764_008274 [Monosporascus ibericus]|uniref:Xylanolytic transcriptional activator regulatory domain-containing protein n=1 Tax=Monosporascus ibericus TaxID=155417 RepID=A0A4Q4T057_9PEZI|nr:hypothetical protein DL764_008274 [Monosporascus ibericus]